MNKDWYSENRVVIASMSPRAADLLDAAPDISAEVFSSKTGHPVARVPAESGNSILLHSSYDPHKEAGTFLSGFNLNEKTVAVVFGFGLGYHVEEMSRRYPWINTIVIVEPNLSLFKLAMRARDLRSMLGSPRCMFVMEQKTTDLLDVLQNWGGRILMGNIVVMQHMPTIQAAPGLYEEFREAFFSAIKAMKMNINTTLECAHIIQRNFIENIPAIVRSRSIAGLAGLFKGKPAICVNSGPSLKNNMHLLRGLKGKAVIIAIDSVLRVLLNNDIIPDFVCTVDFMGINYKKMEGLFDRTGDIALVFDPECSPAIPRDFKGPCFSMPISKALSHWFSQYYDMGAPLEKGLCVSHMAFSLAKFLGADPIVFVGQDLSYPNQDGMSHVEGTDFIAQTILATDQKTGKKYLIYKEKDRVLYCEYLMVEDINGKMVPSDILMHSYLVFYENFISRVSAKVIQASEAGAKIKGTEIMPLSGVIETYCREDVDTGGLIRSALREWKPVDLDALLAGIRSYIDRLSSILELSVQGIDLVGGLMAKYREGKYDSQKEQPAFRESDRIKDKIMALMPDHYIFAIQGHVSSNIHLVNRSANLRSDNLEKKGQEYRVLERVLLFYEGIKFASSDLKEYFMKTLKELGSQPGTPSSGNKP